MNNTNIMTDFIGQFNLNGGNILPVNTKCIFLGEVFCGNCNRAYKRKESKTLKCYSRGKSQQKERYVSFCCM